METPVPVVSGKNEIFRITLPLPRFRRNGRYHLLGMNEYRNLHHLALNDARREYQSLISAYLLPWKGLRLGEGIFVRYLIKFRDRRKRDLTNFGAVVDKFFLDVLVDLGMIEDDSVPHVAGVEFRFAGYGEDKVTVVVKRSCVQKGERF